MSKFLEISAFGRNIRRPLLVCLILTFLFATVAGQSVETEAKELPPPVDGLVSVLFPDINGLEPTVVKQLIESRNDLFKEAAGDTSTRTRLADFYAAAGRVYFAYSMPETAENCFRNAGILMPGDFRWQHLLGLALLEQNKNLDAVEAFKASVRQNPKFVPSLVQSGTALLEIDLNGLAGTAFEMAYAIAPNDPAVLYGLGRVRYSQSKFEESVTLFEKAVKALPNADRIHYSLALSYRKLGNIEKAKEHFEKHGNVGVKVADPLLDEIDQIRSGVRAKLQEAKTALDAGQFEAASKLYLEVLNTEPGNITALANLGTSYLRLNKVNEAAAAYKKVLAIEPLNLNTNFNLGVIYSLAEKPSDAVRHFKNVLEVRPSDAEARFRLARELRKAGLTVEAIKEYRQLISENPENEAALLEVIPIMSDRGLDQELFEMLKQIYGKFPSRGRTAAAYSFLLSSSPLLELRDAVQALTIAKSVYGATGAAEHGILVALALAENGKCSEASEFAAGLRKSAADKKQLGLVAKLDTEIKRFSNPSGCRQEGK